MTNSQRWKTLTCFLLIHAAALSGSATEIRLKQRVNSQGSVVLLGDIADVTADPSRAGSERPAKISGLARLELFPAPGAARSRKVRRREIRELLGLHGVDLTELRFTGSAAVVIESPAQPGPRQVRWESPAAAPAEQTFGAAQPIAAEKRTPPPTELVLATARNVQRGEVIRASAVKLVPVPVSGKGSVTSLGIEPALQPEEVIGMAATRRLAANQPLDLRTLRRPIVVRRGDLVTVTSKAPGVRVETVARAVEDAALGDLVLLESLVNRKKYAAHVTGAKLAEVYASGIRVSSPAQPATEKPNSPSQQRGAP